jgi:hypothetical protein
MSGGFGWNEDNIEHLSKMIERTTKTRSPASAKLEEMSREFGRPDYSPRFGKAPRGEQERHDRAIRAAKKKRGRPMVGKGAERIQITVERSLLDEADTYAKRRHISRSELIAQGLRMAMGN